MVRILCPAGLTDLIAPIFVDGQHVATVLAGQVFEGSRSNRLRLTAEKHIFQSAHKAQRARLKRQWLATPVVSRRQLNAYSALLASFTKIVSECASHWLMAPCQAEPLPVTRAKEFLHAHASNSATLASVARHVQLSPQYLCKLFKQTTGMTLGQYTNYMRVEKARHLLLGSNCSVKETAFEVGFVSISHFSRVFREHTGVCPLTFQAKHRQRKAK